MRRHLPSTANEGFKLPLHMITGNKVSLGHLLPFGSLLYIAKKKHDVKDPKFYPRAKATVYLGHCVREGRKCLKGYTFNFKNKGQRGRIMYSTHTYSLIQLTFHSETQVKKESYHYQEQATCQEKRNLIGKFLFHLRSKNEHWQALQKCNMMLRH